MPARPQDEVLGKSAHPLTGASGDYDPLIDWIGSARVVLLGEATHGTHEFYHERAEITKRLITERGFTAVAVEADWPDAYRINRYVRGMSQDAESIDALADFKRFPTWMWRNADMLDFVGWLRAYNDSLPGKATKVGFYGLDLYSLHSSIEAVLRYLREVDPDAAKRAEHRYACFDHYGEDTQAYAYAAGFGMTKSCESEVVNQLVELRRKAEEYARRDGRIPQDEYFYTEQNARLIKNAEHYYRTMFQGQISSWNLRDGHMAETLDTLLAHLGGSDQPAKVVVWEHNSHVGDARATQMGDAGELNVGQLARERYGREARLVGFTTYTGTVTAASGWDGPAERKRVRPALPESYEAVFHDLAVPRILIKLSEKNAIPSLRQARLERAIGVIYLPNTERLSHYFTAHLSAQFDAVLHFDVTRAVEPLDRTSGWEAGEIPETFPSGI
jgi:erythromycin esterase-like protein